MMVMSDGGVLVGLNLTEGDGAHDTALKHTFLILNKLVIHG